VTLLAHANVTTWEHADEILQLEIRRQNAKLSRSTGKIPAQVLADALLADNSSLRPCLPSSLLDLRLSLRTSRRVNHDHTIDFEGLNFEISATKRKFVTIVHHPHSKFWVLELPPKDVWPSVLGAFSL
jgi:hypothetical protein